MTYVEFAVLPNLDRSIVTASSDVFPVLRETAGSRNGTLAVTGFSFDNLTLSVNALGDILVVADVKQS